MWEVFQVVRWGCVTVCMKIEQSQKEEGSLQWNWSWIKIELVLDYKSENSFLL